MTAPALRQALDHEVRAVEEGHHARQLGDGVYRVASDSVPGKWFRVTVWHAPGTAVVFGCHPDGDRCYRDDHLRASSDIPGLACCKHAALVARRLEREGTIVWCGGYWVDARPWPPPVPCADPFDVFPR